MTDIENKIIKILETKIRPAVARDGGDIRFKEFGFGVIWVCINILYIILSIIKII